MTVERSYECPCCNQLKSFSHLDIGTRFGPWYCEGCGNGIKGTVTDTGVDIELSNSKLYKTLDLLYTVTNTGVDIELSDSKLYKTLDLLYLDIRSEEPIFFVCNGFHIGKPGLTHEQVSATDPSYYYNEHTCPSNIFRMPVIAGKDSDPHGLLRFVSRLSFKLEYEDLTDIEKLDLFTDDMDKFIQKESGRTKDLFAGDSYDDLQS